MFGEKGWNWKTRARCSAKFQQNFFVFGNFPAETKFRWKEPIPAEYKVNRTGSKLLIVVDFFRYHPYHISYYLVNLFNTKYHKLK